MFNPKFSRIYGEINMMTKTRTINEWADFWRYDIGVNVIPANTKYKKPIVAWTEWQSKPIPKEIHEQWKREKQFDNGMAIVAGKIWHSSIKEGLYLCAIDCDNKKAIEELMPNGVLEYARKTLIEMHPDDSNKCHIYFYTTKPVPKKSSDATNPKQSEQLKNNEIPALEVKGDGKHGIMYVTPSVHKNGTRYQILEEEHPVLLDEIPIAIDRICKQYSIPYLDNVQNNNSLIPMNEILTDSTQIHEGHNRHLAMLRYADHIFASSPPSITDKLAMEILLAKNNIMCQPPLENNEIEKLFTQSKEKVKQWKNERQENKDNNNDEKPKIKDYADQIMTNYDFITIDDTEELYIYQEGVYIPTGSKIVKENCERIIDDCKRYHTEEVIAAIKRRTYTERKNFDTNLNMINLKNCWVDIQTGKTIKHSPKILSKIQIPIFYDPEKIPINFIKFLKQCLPKQTDLFTIWEQFASCLLKTSRFGKAFMYVGMGSNGKSVFLHAVERCLGPDIVSHASIHGIENNRFIPADLDGKLANIYNDISNEELNTTGTFKNLVTGDPIIAEKKNKQPFSLKNFAKMFFSANQIPIVYDESDGFFRRFMIIEWNKRFVDRGADTLLLEKITTEDEKSGILNILIHIARELDKRGYFKYADSVEKLRKKWKNKADSVNGFLEKCLVYDDSLVIEKKRLYDNYVKYCTDNKLFAKNRKDFQTEVKMNSPLEDSGKPTRINVLKPSWRYCKSEENDKTVRVWRGAMLKKDVKLEDNIV